MRSRWDRSGNAVPSEHLSCVMSAQMPIDAGADVVGLAALLSQRNPAPYASCVRVETGSGDRERIAGVVP